MGGGNVFGGGGVLLWLSPPGPMKSIDLSILGLNGCWASPGKKIEGPPPTNSWIRPGGGNVNLIFLNIIKERNGEYL